MSRALCALLRQPTRLEKYDSAPIGMWQPGSVPPRWVWGCPAPTASQREPRRGLGDHGTMRLVWKESVGTSLPLDHYGYDLTSEKWRFKKTLSFGPVLSKSVLLVPDQFLQGTQQSIKPIMSYTFSRAYVYACVCAVCVCVCIHIYIYVYMYIFIYIFI